MTASKSARCKATCWSASPDERARILGSLRRVGRDKAVGHLPLHTIRDLPGLSVEDLAAEATPKGLSSLLCDSAGCCIKSGAFYVFDRRRLAALLAGAPDALIGCGWPAEPDGFVRALAAEWLEPNHPVIPLVCEAFGDRIAG
jgi:hypothetical protein